MQSLHYVGSGRVEWRAVRDAEILAADDAVVRPLAAAACDLDAAIVGGVTPYEPPFALGHEFAGEVVAVGEAAKIAIGARVIVPFQISCGECRSCRRGVTSACGAVPRTSMYGIGEKGGSWGGAFSDLVRVPFASHMLMPLPADVSPSVAARIGDNVADGYRAVKALEDQPGATVLILSAGIKGSVALYAALAARALGAEQVDFYDADATRLEVARSLGATPHEIDAWPKRVAARAITVDATQDPDGLACALRSTEPGGLCTSTSMYFQPLVGVPMTEMYMKGVTLHTSRVSSRALLPQVLALVESGRLDPERVPADVVTWADLDRALLDFGTKLIAVRDDAARR